MNMERVKNKCNLLILEHTSDAKLLKVIQKRSSRLATMGVICNGTHFFYPEEGVWLMEIGQAAIVSNGFYFSIQQGSYHLLDKLEVPFAKYLVYSHLKRAGYIVLPSDRDKEVQSSKDCPPGVSSENLKSRISQSTVAFPVDLLNKFPSLNANNPILLELYKQEKIAMKFGISAQFPVRNATDYSFTWRGQDRLRPAHWPSFIEMSKSVKSWKDYRVSVKQLCSRKRCRRDTSLSFLQLDYDVFVNDGRFSHTRASPPSYQLYIVRNAYYGFPSQTDLVQLSSRVCVSKLLIAVVRGSAVLFYDVSHKRIKL